MLIANFSITQQVLFNHIEKKDALKRVQAEQTLHFLNICINFALCLQ